MNQIVTTIAAWTMLLAWVSPASGDNNGGDNNGPRFSRVVDSAVAVDGGLSRGVAWGDIDGDGAPDLMVANTINQLDHLYLNRGDGTFQQVHEHGITLENGWSEGVHFIDFNNDNRLDLFVARTARSTLFRNAGGMNFEAVTIAGATDLDLAASEACWADYDNDGFIDFYLALRGGVPGRLFHNRGGETFDQVRTGDFAAFAGDARTCAWGDGDGDGDPDLFVGNFATKGEGARNFLFKNEGGKFTNWQVDGITTTPNLTYGASWVDFDMDGDLDLYVANGTEGTEDIDGYGLENFFYVRDGGRFTRVMVGAPTNDSNMSAGAAAADYDGDGDIDIYVANWGDSDEDNALYRNQGRSGNWLRLCLIGGASNSHGIGARVILTLAGGGRQISRYLLPDTGYGSTNEPVLHFGLGPAAGATAMRIMWPSGHVDEITEHFAGGQSLSIKENIGVVARRRSGFCTPRKELSNDPS